ncbi:hypothetical protein CON65_05220 [Bacillus pseudomycoides]|uniref:Uncharacterized protein n=1 Tax=Bacillus pseudomycoides TaxID=64104 RepID=A0AA91ZUS7_9BACI|nr:hypothetical protein COO03_15470 [Bacillus sp. AFS098217]PED83697.1 hypothetical protein CON65_05220 [Bacillus pseudomycoides]PEU12402.1 hypothetical protein CN524_13380 [Bacillus sp. AFS019443]PEU21764.1 hypothetical protein CN525_01515 [Bacillus sp. AFS014408]PFW62125.1 hypothetical protein COL20_14755 [Bacillus sp. AFS075034]
MGNSKLLYKVSFVRVTFRRILSLTDRFILISRMMVIFYAESKTSI